MCLDGCIIFFAIPSLSSLLPPPVISPGFRPFLIIIEISETNSKPSLFDLATGKNFPSNRGRQNKFNFRKGNRRLHSAHSYLTTGSIKEKRINEWLFDPLLPLRLFSIFVLPTYCLSLIHISEPTRPY